MLIIKDLSFDTRLHRLVAITDSEVDATVSAGTIRVLNIQHEVLVLLFGPQVRAVPFPAFFTVAWLDQERTIVLSQPIAGGLPASQVLVVKKRLEASLSSRKYRSATQQERKFSSSHIRSLTKSH